MKYARLAVLIVACCLPAMAWRGTGRTVHIPFAFELADKLMPAGDYWLTHFTATPGVVLIEGANLQRSAYVLTGLTAPDVPTLGETSLTFNRFEDRYFLTSVTFLDLPYTVVPERKGTSHLQDREGGLAAAGGGEDPGSRAVRVCARLSGAF